MPAYSMGKANKQPSFIQKNDAPGAGAYQTSSWQKLSRNKTSPCASMPKTKKFFSQLQLKSINVGPGSYNPEKPHCKIAPSLKSRTKLLEGTESPSPANYNVEPKFISLKYSFGKSCRKFKTENGPGPANYNVDAIGEHLGGPIFGKEEKSKQIDEKIPGPGAYDSTKTEPVIGKGHQEFSFPKEKKFVLEDAQIKTKSKVPGPGAYTISNFKQFYRGGKFTYGERMAINIKTEGPGPGFYNIQYASEKKNPNAIIGNQKRQFYNTPSYPGPGSYQIPKNQVIQKKQAIAIFPQEERDKKENCQTPGPGSYLAKPLHESRAYSMGSRLNSITKDQKPGPQKYNPDHSKVEKAPARAIFGNEKRLTQDKNLAPGPGEYSTSKLDPKKSFYFNKAKSNSKLDSTVGPGQYKLRPYIGLSGNIRKDQKEILFV